MTEAQHAPIGIDLGSYVSCIAVAKRGGIEIITNEANFRQTPTVVGYGAGERLIGQAGNAKLKTNFRDTVTYPNRFLGLDANYPKLKQELKYIPARSSKGENGRLYFNVNYQGQQQTLLPEQVMAGFISKIRTIIAMNKLVNNQAVISVPSYYTQLQRQALLNACKIAQLNVTRLLNESTAVALDYGIFRKNDLDEKTPRNVLFVDFGHSKLSTFVVAFTKQKATVLAQKHDRNIGCRNIDYILLQHYQKIFEKSSGGIDFMENRKSIVKMLEVIEKQRKILSANSQHHMGVQCLQQDCDLDSNLTRQQFEAISQPIFDQVSKVIAQLKIELDSKGISLQSIQMVGGGTRIPAFQKIITDVFKIQPSRTLNSSESIAKGCALMAAIRSPLFKVAPYDIEEINYYPIRAYWNFIQGNPSEGNEKEYPQKQTTVLFASGALVPITKTLKFARKEGIEMLLNYDPAVQGFNHQIVYYKSPVQNPKEAEFSVVYKIGINENGLVGLQQTFLQQDTIEEIKTAKPKAEGAPADQQPQYDIKTSKKSQQKPINCELRFQQLLTTKDLATCFEVESKMVNQDRHLLQTYERKNELESLIYNSKQKLGSIFKDFVETSKIPEILQKLEVANDWLYSEGQHSTRGMYTQKLDELKPLIEPIAKRYQSHQQIRDALVVALQSAETNNTHLNSQDPKYSHITSDDRTPAGKQIQKLQQLVNTTNNTLSTTPKHENLKVTANEVYKQITVTNESVKKIMSKPIPPPPAPPKADPPKAADPAQPAPQADMQVEKPPTEQKSGMDVQK